ncbi:MAG: polyphosphate kinase 1 [Bacteroidetes bacterium]|nr:polyphosphate kinase 1 [Bacteroidota bacterium]HET6242947.1 polyphosphate kinase 1 [Bacteroidia bacterium]
MSTKKVEVINREISWLSFNERVLQEACDPTVPLIERIKFLGIFSNNRDEFFQVRVATIKRMAKIGKKAQEIIGENPSKVLKEIQEIVIKQQKLFESTYKNLLKEFEKQNIFIINESQLSKKQGEFVKNYFHQVVRPTLVPIMLDDSLAFPYLKEKATHLLVKLNSHKKSIKAKHAVLEVPSSALSRFVVLPSEQNKHYIIILDDVIRYCLNDIFLIFDFKSIEAHTIKLTRDAELDIDNDINKSLIEKITKSLKKRKTGAPVRLVYDGEMAPDLLNLLTTKLKLNENDNLIPGGRYHNFKDFMNFPDIGLAELRYQAMPCFAHPDFAKKHKNMFEVIRKKDVLLTYPYQSFGHVIDLLREAAIDPDVLAIKISLYRVAKNSNIINTLVNAQKNGKSVTVILELQARFDEEANIYWANKLQDEGVKVIFGVPGLKIHAKLFLITRKNGSKTEEYAHIGTGNFNENTSGIYSDHSLLTADKRITMEVIKLFNFFTNNFKTNTYRHLIVSPFSMRKRFIQLINNEIKNANAGKKAFIHIKLNNITDAVLIEKLYEASKAGVKIKMMIRGVCSLIPGIKKFSQNIEVISIVDRFLEHSRIFAFCNEGEELYFLSSADWMVRSMDHRVEVACPIYDKQIQKEIKDFMNIQFKGNIKSRVINGERNNSYRKIDSDKPVRAQYELYEYFRNKLQN